MPGKSRLIDVNILAIYLVEDHPGNSWVSRALDSGLSGAFRILAPEQLPLRSRWVLTAKWGIEKTEADRAIRAFLEQTRVQYVGADRETLRDAFSLADELHHDVYDTYYLALARAHGVDGLLTTDRDFLRLCKRIGLEYENPVPARVLRGFGSGVG